MVFGRDGGVVPNHGREGGAPWEDAYGMDEFPKHRWKQHRGRGTQIAHRLRREARAGSPPEQLDDEFKAFVRRLTRAVRITRINWGDAGETPAGEGIHGAQPCIGERESAVREKHEHGLLRCGRPPDE